MILFNMAVAYAPPIAVWLIWKHRTPARTFPMLVGIIAYMFISMLRGMARFIVLNDALREHVWLFYIVSALLSGIFEEAGRYIVFRWCIPNYDRWTDCISYGIGHGAIEVFLTHNILEMNFYDSLITGQNFLRAMLFSSVMSVLVFSAVHYTEHKKLLLLAIGLHTVTDILPALFLNDIVNFIEADFLDLLYLTGICYIAYRVYRYFNPKEVNHYDI